MLKASQQHSQNPTKTAIVADGKAFSYEALRTAARQFAGLLLQRRTDLSETRVAFMVVPGFDYVRVQWGIWQAGGVAVPLCTTYPLSSLEYVIEDTEAEIIVVSPEFEPVLRAYVSKKGLRFLVLTDTLSGSASALPVIEASRRAMILYTSGTTSLPKGVVTTHAAIEAQVTTLVDAWAYSSQDTTLCILPLHHVHGIINVISCTLWAGGTVEFLPNFSAEAVFDWFLKIANQPGTGVFMAVPTIYFKLIARFETLDTAQQQALTAAMTTFRLMVSGSAALPVSVMEKWEIISGHRLLERYGMTELGMAISNPYRGERRAGHIGQPLPGVSVRLVDDAGNEIVSDVSTPDVTTPDVSTPGEIQVKGDNVFSEYWRKKAATEAAFTIDGWFKTGDVAVLDDGYYKILGRSSIDIIKSGGYKLSALEIEEVLRTHPHIADCSVVGIENDEWGELVAAALVVNNPLIDLQEVNSWMREKLPAYKVPRQYKIMVDLPRNAMGKVTKNDLKKLF